MQQQSGLVLQMLFWRHLSTCHVPASSKQDGSNSSSSAATMSAQSVVVLVSINLVQQCWKHCTVGQQLLAAVPMMPEYGSVCTHTAGIMC
jgi:hypothetical protein